MNFEKTLCSKCSHINPPHKNICENCKNHLRERIVNIDLWTTILSLIENPKSAFKNIVYAEHKNFIYFLLFFISIKNLIISRFISVPEIGLNGVTSSLITSIILSILSTILFFVVFTSIQIQLYKKNIYQLRFIDFFSLNIYAFTPYLIGLFLIFPVQLIVLGGDIFSNNPYPFLIKPFITYLLLGFEVLMIVWTVFLFIKSLVSGIKKRTAVLLVLIFFSLWVSILYLSSIIIFTI